MSKLYTSSGSNFNLVLWQRRACGLVQFRHKNSLVKVRKMSGYGSKISGFVNIDTTGNIPSSCQMYPVKLPQTQEGKCLFFSPLKLPRGMTLTNVETLSWKVVIGLAAFYRHHHPLLKEIWYESTWGLKMLSSCCFRIAQLPNFWGEICVLHVGLDQG